LTLEAIFFGCSENCFPFAVSARFLRVVAAYCLLLIDFIAFSGKYRSPVALGPCVDGLPLLVRHFCLVHAFNDLWGFFNPAISFYSPHLWPCILLLAFEPFEQTIGPAYRLCLQTLFAQKASYAL
jgi:hypothetical protein